MPDENSLSLYKFIVLYILKLIDGPVTNAQISEFILGRGYTDYFTVQQSINDLIETGMIKYEKVMNKSRCTITEEGSQTLDIFMDKLTPGIREDIKEYLKENGYAIKEINSVRCDYTKGTNDDYIVNLNVTEEKQPVIDIKIAVPTEEAAITLCSNWKDKSSQVYGQVLAILLD